MKIAAVVPCYNSSGTIAETLKSIFEQSYPCHEVIIVDDGSSDGTEEKVRQFDKVKYIRQKNSGVSAARNKGVEVAESDWIAFCDADDIWHPNKMEICATCIGAFPRFSFLYHDFFLFKNKNGSIQRASTPSKNAFSFFLDNNVGLTDIFRENDKVRLTPPIEDHACIDVYLGNVFQWLMLGNFILPSTTLITKQKFLEHQGFDTQFRSAEETEFFLRLSKETDFMYLDFPLTGYRKSESGLTSNKLFLLENGLRALMKNCVDDQLIYDKFRNTIDLGISKRYSRMSYLHLSELRTKEAMKTAIASIRYCPTQRKGWLYLAASMMPVFLLARVRKFKVQKRTEN